MHVIASLSNGGRGQVPSSYSLLCHCRRSRDCLFPSGRRTETNETAILVQQSLPPVFSFCLFVLFFNETKDRYVCKDKTRAEAQYSAPRFYLFTLLLLEVRMSPTFIVAIIQNGLVRMIGLKETNIRIIS